MEQKIEIFFCYAREDETLRQVLEKQLRSLRRQGIIDLWRDRDISAGVEWQRAIDQHLNAADIILLLVSPDFMDSDYCYSIEMKQAMERHDRGEALVIPIILRPVFWQKSPFGKLQALPTDAKPVTSSSWNTQDEAFFDIAEGIRLAAEQILANRDPKHWIEQGDQHFNQKRYEEALIAFEQAIRLNPNDANTYRKKGLTLQKMNRYKEAVPVFEQSIRLNPNNADNYREKGISLSLTGSNEAAITAFEQAIRLNPNDAENYYWKGLALSSASLLNNNLKEEAIAVFDQAIRLNPNYAAAYDSKGNQLRELGRSADALIFFEQAVRLDPSNIGFLYRKALTLEELGRYEESLIVYDQAIKLDPKPSYFYRCKGNILTKLGRYDEANQMYEMAAKPELKMFP